MKKYFAFSLIELLITVAIVAILAAIAVPVYKDYSSRAKLANIVAKFQNIGSAFDTKMAASNTLPTPSQLGYTSADEQTLDIPTQFDANAITVNIMGYSNLLNGLYTIDCQNGDTLYVGSYGGVFDVGGANNVLYGAYIFYGPDYTYKVCAAIYVDGAMSPVDPQNTPVNCYFPNGAKVTGDNYIAISDFMLSNQCDWDAAVSAYP